MTLVTAKFIKVKFKMQLFSKKKNFTEKVLVKAYQSISATQLPIQVICKTILIFKQFLFPILRGCVQSFVIFLSLNSIRS